MKAGFVVVIFLALCVVANAQIASADKRKADSLSTLVKQTSGLDKANALFELAKVYCGLNVDSTKLFIDEALGICRRLDNDTTYMAIAGGIEDYLGRVGEKDLALKYLI